VNARFAPRSGSWFSSGMRLAAVLLVVSSCAPVLPSTTPLGEGPLAKAEAQAREKAERDAEASNRRDVASASEKPSGHSPAATPPSAGKTPAPKPETPKKPEPPAAKPDADKKPAPASNVVYAGEYVGSDVTETKIMGQESSQKDDKARTRVDVAKNGELDVTFIDSSNGQDICTLHAKPDGKKATFAPGQKCWAEGDAGGTLTSGHCEFSDKKLIVEADFDIVGPEGSGMSGSIHYRFEGTRK
jgi:hypothetical protein